MSIIECNIGSPSNWNEIISVDSYFNGKKDYKNYLRPLFFNIDDQKEKLDIEYNKDSISINKEKLTVLLKEGLNLINEKIINGDINCIYYKKEHEKIIKMLELIKNNEKIKFKKFEPDTNRANKKILNSLTSFSSDQNYVLDLSDYFFDFNLEKFKEMMSDSIYFLPLDQLDKSGLLKNINPIIGVENGFKDSKELEYAGFVSITGWRNNNSVFIREGEDKEYKKALNDYIELRFGDKSKIKESYKNASFKKTLMKEYLVNKKGFVFLRKVRSKNEKLYQNDEGTIVSFYEGTGHCKMMNEKDSLNKNKISCFARNGELMNIFYIKTTGEGEKKIIKRRDFTKNENCISNIIFKKNKEFRHIIRLQKSFDIYTNNTLSLFKMLKKYNSSDAYEKKLIQDEIEIKTLNLMQEANISVEDMSKRLDDFDTEETRKISNETLDLISMIYSR